MKGFLSFIVINNNYTTIAIYASFSHALASRTRHLRYRIRRCRYYYLAHISSRSTAESMTAPHQGFRGLQRYYIQHAFSRTVNVCARRINTIHRQRQRRHCRLIQFLIASKFVTYIPASSPCLLALICCVHAFFMRPLSLVYSIARRRSGISRRARHGRYFLPPPAAFARQQGRMPHCFTLLCCFCRFPSP